MKKGKIILIVLIILAAIYFVTKKPSGQQSSSVSTTAAPTATATQTIAQKTSAPTNTPVITEEPSSKGSYRDNYNAIAKYPMSELEANTRKFRQTAEAGGCYIEFNNYRDTVGYYEIIVNAKSSKNEDASVFIQVCQDMITSICPSISKNQLDTITKAIKDQKSLEDYSLGDGISVTYHRPISWSSGYISIKIP